MWKTDQCRGPFFTKRIRACSMLKACSPKSHLPKIKVSRMLPLRPAKTLCTGLRLWARETKNQRLKDVTKGFKSPKLERFHREFKSRQFRKNNREFKITKCSKTKAWWRSGTLVPKEIKEVFKWIPNQLRSPRKVTKTKAFKESQLRMITRFRWKTTKFNLTSTTSRFLHPTRKMLSSRSKKMSKFKIPRVSKNNRWMNLFFPRTKSNLTRKNLKKESGAKKQNSKISRGKSMLKKEEITRERANWTKQTSR